MDWRLANWAEFDMTTNGGNASGKAYLHSALAASSVNWRMLTFW